MEEYPELEFPAPRTVNEEVLSKSVTAFELKNLTPDSKYCFKVSVKDNQGNVLSYVQKTTVIPPRLKGGLLQIINRAQPCLVDVEVKHLLSGTSSLLYLLMAGGNLVHEESKSSYLTNIALPRSKNVLVKVRNSLGDEITVLPDHDDQFEYNCTEVNKETMEIIKKDCLQGNVKRCRANLVNVLLTKPNDQMMEAVEDIMDIIETSTLSNDKTNEIDLSTAYHIFQHGSRRKKRQAAQPGASITTTDQLKELVAQYQYESMDIFDTVLAGLRSFLALQCLTLSDIGVRPIITKDNPETNVQVLDTYINIYIHKEILGLEPTDNQDGTVIHWNPEDTFYSSWNCLRLESCVGVCNIGRFLYI